MTKKDLVAKAITAQHVVLMMKGKPGNSPCGFSNRLVSILDHTGVTYATHDVLVSEGLRAGVKDKTKVRTFPQLFIGGMYAGGSDDIRKMHEAGTLITFLTDREVAVKPSKDSLVVGDVSREQLIACKAAS